MQEFISVIPKSMVDDFFMVGFASAFIGYLYYLYLFRHDPKNQIGFLLGIYGAFLSGCIGGMLAIVFDKALELSIVVGLFSQIIYMALLKSIRGKKFFEIVREILVKYLTAGTK